MIDPHPASDAHRDTMIDAILAEHYDATCWIIEDTREAPAAVRQSAAETARKLADLLPACDGLGAFIARHHKLTAALREDQTYHGCHEGTLDQLGWPHTVQAIRKIDRDAAVATMVAALTSGRTARVAA
ncbi:hypothetical protein [Iamia sp.]|uniref:hypothetical protein n=1 Tax=Iamia sp. TaxID=2722710 RepID=UPI002C9120C6|nr:hypothetical protein [Iamia sp.]HXH56586.1 hypothetical protein [Iamia sp.]